MNDEYLARCVLDITGRKVYLYSSEGSEKEVSCETVDQFMNVVEFIRKTLDENLISYSSPL